MANPATTQVVILCGGRGTRLQEKTHAIPKALVEIGNQPIIWHVVRIYAAQGFRSFTLLTGYLHEEIEAFLDKVEWPEEIDVRAIDTGVDTPTGGRVHRIADQLRESGTFCLTYADGVADIDLAALIGQHREQHGAHGVAATMTITRPYSQWGIANVESDGRISGFTEKPRLDHWINGGFFCLEPEVLAYLEPNSVFEREPLERLAAAGKLSAYEHHGFWDCMDTYKDMIELNDLWAAGVAPWRVWDKERESEHA
jgi:glucose-1-phosphate cytidylyltransferase